MAISFEFATAARIAFGEGSLREAVPAASSLGRRALVVTGRSPDRALGLVDDLRKAGLDCETFAVAGEPTVSLADRGARAARESSRDVVVALGGGSVIDGAKAIAALAANQGEALDYLEVIGRGRPLANPSLPVIAIPTTAGTGSEVTRNAVLASPERGVKASLRAASMLPRVAIVDPLLTQHLPPALTASTGLDALTQLIEPHVSSRANPLTSALALEGIRRVRDSLERACQSGSDAGARADMSLASLFGGLCLANAGLGVVHGFAAPIGGAFDAPHGAVCAALLAHGMRANIRALKERQSDAPALDAYRTIAALLTNRNDAASEEGADWVARLTERLSVPPLRAYGITPADVPGLVEKAAAASSMKANPIKLTPDELRHVLESAL